MNAPSEFWSQDLQISQASPEFWLWDWRATCCANEAVIIHGSTTNAVHCEEWRSEDNSRFEANVYQASICKHTMLLRAQANEETISKYLINNYHFFLLCLLSNNSMLSKDVFITLLISRKKQNLFCKLIRRQI